jgi:hypothetical protein
LIKRHERISKATNGDTAVIERRSTCHDGQWFGTKLLPEAKSAKRNGLKEGKLGLLSPAAVVRDEERKVKLVFRGWVHVDAVLHDPRAFVDENFSEFTRRGVQSHKVNDFFAVSSCRQVQCCLQDLIGKQRKKYCCNLGRNMR